jgi:hypothetical protein
LHFSPKPLVQKDIQMEIRVPAGVLEHYKALPEDQLVIEVARLVDYRDLIAYACTRIFRNLEDEEREVYNISIDKSVCP